MAKATCEDSLRFSNAKLQTTHNFEELISSGWRSWGWWCNGERYASLNYYLDLENKSLQLSYNWREKPIQQTIGLTTTPMHFGGKRWWFICPHTGLRCGFLFSPVGQPYFASRKSFGLVYKSQREDLWYRLLRRSQKLENRYGVPEWGEGWFPKPKGMHLRTYHNRLAELDWYQKKLDERFIIKAESLLRVKPKQSNQVLSPQ